MDQRIRKVAVERTLISYESVVDHKIHRNVFEDVIPGVLKVYDLPALARIVAPREMTIVDAANPVGQRVPLDVVRSAYATAKVVKRGAGDTAANIYGFADSR